MKFVIDERLYHPADLTLLPFYQASLYIFLALCLVAGWPKIEYRGLAPISVGLPVNMVAPRILNFVEREP